LARLLQQPPHHIRRSTTGTDIFRARQAFLDKTETFRAGLPLFLPRTCTDATQTTNHNQADETEDRQRQSHTPINTIEQDQHTEHQQNIAEQRNQETREEVSQRRNIAIDTLDQLSRSARRVKRWV